MLRPGLVLLSHRAVSEGLTEKKDVEVSIRVAAIVELIHNATLLHDDVIDEGRKRRGQPTINSLYGNESAVLLGDFLLGKVFKVCAELEPEIARIVAATAIRVCEGELRQVSERRNWQLSEAEYIDIITEKSAALFSSCCRLGGLTGGADVKQQQSLADFGLSLGIAFQIGDDLLDIIGDEEKTGKTVGSDFDKSKLTLPVIHLLRAADKKQSDMIKERLNASRKGEGAFTEVLKRFGSLKYAQDRVRDFVAEAVQALSGLRDGDAKDALIETSRYVEQRAT
jgi:octaprenyl-diphosphate synthase